MPSKNEKILRDADKAMEKGDIDGFFAPFADDVVVHIGGRSKLAGVVKGRLELKEKFNQFMAAMGDNPEMETHDILANATHGVVMQSFRGTKNGNRSEFKGVGIFHFDKNGKVTEAWFIDEDPYEADKFYDA
jgi:ketosteroid isomerase-like protein